MSRKPVSIPIRQWPEVERWIMAAEELPAEERTLFLDAECPAHLRALVDRILEGLNDTGSDSGALIDETRIQDALGLAASEASPSPSVDRPHLRIGPYRLVRMLGHGGMGVVYLGERDDDALNQNPDGAVARHVALKVLRADLPGEEAILRFRRERVLLSSVRSPFVPKLLNAGTTTDGRPWFAMEYVDGEPIMDYVERTQPDRQERLRLFHLVCTAVSHIHDYLVVHRDIKPANIFVSERDGQPHVHVLDFGIATVAQTRGEVAAQSVLTLTDDGTAPYSPAFAAPEQRENTPVEPALDVWALGVLLCLLMTGGRPHRFPFCGDDHHACHMGGLCHLAANDDPDARVESARTFGKRVADAD